MVDIALAKQLMEKRKEVDKLLDETIPLRKEEPDDFNQEHNFFGTNEFNMIKENSKLEVSEREITDRFAKLTPRWFNNFRLKSLKDGTYYIGASQSGLGCYYEYNDDMIRKNIPFELLCKVLSDTKRFNRYVKPRYKALWKEFSEKIVSENINIKQLAKEQKSNGLNIKPLIIKNVIVYGGDEYGDIKGWYAADLKLDREQICIKPEFEKDWDESTSIELMDNGLCFADQKNLYLLSIQTNEIMERLQKINNAYRAKREMSMKMIKVLDECLKYREVLKELKESAKD